MLEVVDLIFCGSVEFCWPRGASSVILIQAKLPLGRVYLSRFWPSLYCTCLNLWLPIPPGSPSPAPLHYLSFYSEKHIYKFIQFWSCWRRKRQVFGMCIWLRLPFFLFSQNVFLAHLSVCVALLCIQKRLPSVIVDWNHCCRHDKGGCGQPCSKYKLLKKKKGRKDKEVCGSSVFHERREAVDVGFFLSFGCKKPFRWACPFLLLHKVR